MLSRIASTAGSIDRGGSASHALAAGIEGVEGGLWVIIVHLLTSGWHGCEGCALFLPVLQCSSPDLTPAPPSQMSSAGCCSELQDPLHFCVSVCRYFVSILFVCYKCMGRVCSCIEM